MESPFHIQAYNPSVPSPYSLAPEAIQYWSESLAALTRQLLEHPYDPATWLERAKILHFLQYTELAVGDAWKARSLSRQLLSMLVGKRRGRQILGFRSGFWMLVESEKYVPDGEKRELDEESWTVIDRFRATERASSDLIQTHLKASEELKLKQGEMCYLLRSYPWMAERWRQRGDDVVQSIDDELAAKTAGCCGIRRHAFEIELNDDGKSCSADMLGVFAKQRIDKGDRVLVDRTALWGCSDQPVKNESWEGCDVASHPGWGRIDDQRVPEGGGLHWVRERCGQDCAGVVVLIKTLLQCCTSTRQQHSASSAIASESRVESRQHPLDHPIISRLTASYCSRTLLGRKFNIEHDIASPYYALERHSNVDIFADHRFDTWVLLTVLARLENNATSSLGMSAVFPVFSLFNHDCNPNIHWRIASASMSNASETHHNEVFMIAARDIEAGEQLCVCYNTYMEDKPLEERQKMLSQWLEEGCKCDKCVTQRLEEAEGLAPSQDVRRAAWDVDERPVLPEDRGDSLVVSSDFQR